MGSEVLCVITWSDCTHTHIHTHTCQTGLTALDVARDGSHQAMCKLLEQRGAKVNSELTEVGSYRHPSLILSLSLSLSLS